ncbi:ubiquitin carboxyl-terminal hydrolase 25 [Selaginella moellendorffii]|nr:ubiquitin carboxyl-terminal hydrolase 25 [Selaginella moellendorffii]|eukprot:XP_002972625.2 ubiquitin carboxyl-terminal hydrolase 25 [Selaginella moellendorffii]
MAVIPSLDISWQGNHKRKCKPLGFKNLGNTCYLNSVLQCLTYTPPLANYCLRGQHSKQCDGANSACPFCMLENRISRSFDIEVPVDAPQRIYKYLQTFAKHFRAGRQEDAHELLRYAIDACDSACARLQKRGSKSSDQTVMKEIFGGFLQSQIWCLSCNAVSSKLDSVMDLSLDIVRTKTLKEAICNFFQPEVLDGNNKYQCEKCKKLSVARKQLSIYQSPNVLVIQLKRFENFLGGKIDAHVEFEEELKLRSHMSKNSPDVHPDYSLYAVVVHSGFSQYGGHYYAYVKDPRGQWYCCNDSFVSAASSATVLSERVYILFYVRDSSKISKDGLSSASSTPSPPPTPDPVVLSPNASCSSAKNGQQKVTFSFAKREKSTALKPISVAEEVLKLIDPKTPVDKPESKPPAAISSATMSVSKSTPLENSVKSAKAKDTKSSENGVSEEIQPAVPPSPPRENDAARASESAGSKVSVPQKRQRELEARLHDFKASADFEALKLRLENEGREILKQSGWCDEVRRSTKRCRRDDPEARDKMREELRRQLPESVKEHLVSLLQSFYMTKNFIGGSF